MLCYFLFFIMFLCPFSQQLQRQFINLSNRLYNMVPDYAIDRQPLKKTVYFFRFYLPNLFMCFHMASFVIYFAAYSFLLSPFSSNHFLIISYIYNYSLYSIFTLYTFFYYQLWKISIAFPHAQHSSWCTEQYLYIGFL